MAAIVGLTPLEDVGPLGLASPIGEVCDLLPDQDVLVLDQSTSVAEVCSTLQHRGLRSCVIRGEDGSFGFFELQDICTKLLDALQADSSVDRVFTVLAHSAVGDVSRSRSSVRVDVAAPLSYVVELLSQEPHERVALVDTAGRLVRIFSCSDLLELIIRVGRHSCPALRMPAKNFQGLRQAEVVTVSAGDPVLDCFRKLRSLDLRGLAVLDTTEPQEAWLESAVGVVLLSDVRHMFAGSLDDAVQLAGCTVQEFVADKLQKTTVPVHHGATQYPFLHADVEHDLEVMVCKLVATRACCVALVSPSRRDVVSILSAHDIVHLLHHEGALQGLSLEPGRPGSAVSPRLLPVPPTRAPPPEFAPFELAAAVEQQEGTFARKVSWADDPPESAPLAEVKEYAVEVEKEQPLHTKPLALEDVHAGAAASGEMVSLPRRSNSGLQPSAAGELSPEQMTVQEPMEWGVGTSHSHASTAPVTALVKSLSEALAPCTDGEWAQVENLAHVGTSVAHGGQQPVDHLDEEASAGMLEPRQANGAFPSAGGVGSGLGLGMGGEELQLVLYQHRELVLYDRARKRAFARRLTEEQAHALTRCRLSFCPLCRQPLNPSWAFVVEGYFEMISEVATGSTAQRSASSGTFANNEEASATADLKNIPMSVLNCGYYERFFVEEQKLGSGSFGAVYLCRHVMDGIELGVFAVKKLALGDDNKRLRQVMREVKALERLRHMNIVDYKHSWLEVSRHSEFCPYVPFLYILMEFCNAGSLESLIWPSGFVRGATDNALKATRLDEGLIWRLFLDVCSGLRHLHNRHILHRDLKPSNIMLNVDEGGASQSRVPRAMLSDFGTCEILGETASEQRGGYALEFVAPERLCGLDSDAPADMWSAGLVLFAMCAGDLPYHSDDPEICREQVKAHRVLRELTNMEDPNLWRLIAALTERFPGARPTADEAESACSSAIYQRRGKRNDPIVVAASGVHSSSPPQQHKGPLGLMDDCMVQQPPALVDG